ncbi:helix-turn-helix domain-containing protein [Cyclobacterium amurskyense]|uniref:helix-turn-helix domain-containing protein n=1 Tax=Cyclobacterium amurskyense TaxID=320787 RepID=UPI0030DB20E3|tara:strand:+ start:1608 stop:2441 length:834 start_codon:yes stop_codon:yes gene_type:complete
MIYTGKQNEYFEIQSIDSSNCKHLLESQPEVLKLIWFTSDNNKLLIDGIPYTFNKNELLSLSQLNKLEYEKINSINLLRFNRQFYCILDHDSEVSCKGVLYYGAATPPIIKAADKELEILETAWKMAVLEFEMKDDLQLEMLQMMLKRILILCTRIFKRQKFHESPTPKQNDLFREFNYLVETHFREKHTVAEYSELLFKAPKTISNTFKKLCEKTPLQVIQERIVLEARRLLFYTEKDVSEIGYELGFQDIQSFSRFFKKQEGLSPTDFREQNHTV